MLNYALLLYIIYLMVDASVYDFPEWENDQNQQKLEEGLRILARLIARDILAKRSSNQGTDSPLEMHMESTEGNSDEDISGTL